MSTYCVSDLHGHLELYNQIKEFLKPEDKIICLGDCGDRGPQSWETIRAVASDPQVTFIMGNHEHMLAGAMCEFLEDPRISKFWKSYPDSMLTLLSYNGGYDTFQGWVNDGANPGWTDYLMSLPTTLDYDNGQYIFHLSHAGFTPDKKSFDPLWDRDHFKDPWPEGHDNEIVIHGHTPIQILTKRNWRPVESGAAFYCDGHKIDIDQGTASSKQALLFNLDTFDEHIFTLLKENKK